MPDFGRKYSSIVGSIRSSGPVPLYKSNGLDIRAKLCFVFCVFMDRDVSFVQPMKMCDRYVSKMLDFIHN